MNQENRQSSYSNLQNPQPFFHEKAQAYYPEGKSGEVGQDSAEHELPSPQTNDSQADKLFSDKREVGVQIFTLNTNRPTDILFEHNKVKNLEAPPYMLGHELLQKLYNAPMLDISSEMTLPDGRKAKIRGFSLTANTPCHIYGDTLYDLLTAMLPAKQRNNGQSIWGITADWENPEYVSAHRDLDPHTWDILMKNLPPLTDLLRKQQTINREYAKAEEFKRQERFHVAGMTIMQERIVNSLPTYIHLIRSALQRETNQVYAENIGHSTRAIAGDIALFFATTQDPYILDILSSLHLPSEKAKQEERSRLPDNERLEHWMRDARDINTLKVDTIPDSSQRAQLAYGYLSSRGKSPEVMLLTMNKAIYELHDNPLIPVGYIPNIPPNMTYEEVGRIVQRFKTLVDPEYDGENASVNTYMNKYARTNVDFTFTSPGVAFDNIHIENGVLVIPSSKIEGVSVSVQWTGKNKTRDLIPRRNIEINLIDNRILPKTSPLIPALCVLDTGEVTFDPDIIEQAQKNLYLAGHTQVDYLAGAICWAYQNPKKMNIPHKKRFNKAHRASSSKRPQDMLQAQIPFFAVKKILEENISWE